ncbi:hypothetical protein JOD67_007001 [Tenggerimyces flavus]|nr:hypothetical protein [Tenggerimyces flavus]
MWTSRPTRVDSSDRMVSPTAGALMAAIHPYDEHLCPDPTPPPRFLTRRFTADGAVLAGPAVRPLPHRPLPELGDRLPLGARRDRPGDADGAALHDPDPGPRQGDRELVGEKRPRWGPTLLNCERRT